MPPVGQPDRIGIQGIASTAAHAYTPRDKGALAMPARTLISAAELMPHLDDPKWVIVDCRFDLAAPAKGATEYLDAHIAGAVYAHLERDLSGPPTGRNGRHPLPPPAILAATFSRWGIAPGVQVVGYDDEGGSYAARLWWCLRYLGHDDVAILDGGIAAWREIGGPMRSGEERRRPRDFQPHLRPHMLATVADVVTSVETQTGVLIDTRAPERYRGDVEPIDPVAGHIPGAHNRHWQENVGPDGRMRPSEALRTAFERLLGGRPPTEAIVYCGSGVTACHNLLALEHAGLSGARLYGGSWSEWCSDVTRPIATGAEPTPEDLSR
jgi:thiosulfate/3-mercaptopyruvate sulfurtransferase